ncbi:MAG: hypothetical protein ABSF68_14825 [Candidatus Acidiferrales bacterium]|jgi:hypothetical protein
MKRFLENHPLIRVSVMFLGALALGFAAYYHFTNRSFFLLLTDVPFLILFVYLFFDGIAGMLAAPNPARPDSKDRKT